MNPTYISLFSSAGVGCYGLKMAGFSCVATMELLERRLDIQKYNNKCKYPSGYICGDITQKEIQDKLYTEIAFWKKREHLQKVDVILATPPCQGMSTANYKKGNEINRNSLVVEAIRIIKKVQPRVFVFENVKAFLQTSCIDEKGIKSTINECINRNLSEHYNIYSKVVNFMDYGVPSSRPRTLVIGVLKTEKNFSPLNLFPLKSDHISLRQAIGHLRRLSFGETDREDLLHSFRVYPSYMRSWIHDLKEGETAFNNPPATLPYKLVNGKKQLLKSGHMGNKFRRMYWDQPAPCITTRNDQLASQSTIHPTDDRVLSIRELMLVMTIPNTFQWLPKDACSKENIAKQETLIRQSIGEAVPTTIIYQIAKNIYDMLEYDAFVKSPKVLARSSKLLNNFYIRTFLFEQSLSNTKKTGSFYTPQIVVYNTIKDFHPAKDHVSLLEPSVGAGAFIPQILRLVDDCKEITITCVDISKECISFLQKSIQAMNLSKKFNFRYVVSDFLLAQFPEHYDAVFTNPPYFKLKATERAKYKKTFSVVNDNIFCLFLKKMAQMSDEIMVVIPKTFLMIPDCNDVREIFEKKYSIVSIYDYGVSFFKKVFIEILSLHFKTNYKLPIHIVNCKDNTQYTIPQKYLFHHKIWILYRNAWFDSYISKLQLNAFDFYRDRQLSNKYLTSKKEKIWVLRSKNLQEDGTFIHKRGYDKYISSLSGFSLQKYINTDALLFVNFTYNTRAAILPKNCAVNGSFCLLLPKQIKKKIDLSFYSSEDFRKYYAIVKNCSKFTINVDANSIYYIGVPK